MAAFNGDIRVARGVFDSPKGRKMVQMRNEQGATPLAMAIIAGQVLEYISYEKWTVNISLQAVNKL